MSGGPIGHLHHRMLGHRLPRLVSVPLFGDRRRYGLAVRRDDPDWQEWQRSLIPFYYGTQRGAVGGFVNRAGYRAAGEIDLAGRQVLEIGPGEIAHRLHWRGTPAHYSLADVNADLLATAGAQLNEWGVPCSTARLDEGATGDLPFADAAFDVVFAFYVLEHLHPLANALSEILRVLRPGGLLVGAIPTEGGLAWGLGRFLTSRRWLKKHTQVKLEKILCWEHPNFAEDVLRALDNRAQHRTVRYWPLGMPSLDLNLIVWFIYGKA